MDLKTAVALARNGADPRLFLTPGVIAKKDSTMKVILENGRSCVTLNIKLSISFLSGLLRNKVSSTFR